MTCQSETLHRAKLSVVYRDELASNDVKQEKYLTGRKVQYEQEVDSCDFL